jgi:GTP-binding protein YchF
MHGKRNAGMEGGMKIGIIGLPGAGKTTVFAAITKLTPDAARKGENRIGTVAVPDLRLRDLSAIYKPKKIIHAQITYLLPSIPPGRQEDIYDQAVFVMIKDCDAVIHVVRNFGHADLIKPSPLADFSKLDQELMLNDLMVVEKRLERLLLDRKRGKKINEDEMSLLSACRGHLERGISLRQRPELAGDPLLKGYALISAKPMLVLFNNADNDENLPNVNGGELPEKWMVIRGRLEQDLSQISEKDAKELASEFHITESAMDRVIKQSYALLGLISFFTVLSDEVRAWTIRRGSTALDAAGIIHTDMKKGFIRAEVINHQELMEAGSFAEAKKKGSVRLEGKTYTVADGDILQVRFNV